MYIRTRLVPSRRMLYYSWIFYFTAMAVWTSTSGEPVNRRKGNLVKAKETSDIDDVIATTVAPPSGLGLLAAPPTSENDPWETSGTGSQEGKSSGMSSSEHVTSGVGSKEQRSSGLSSREDVTGLSGAGSKEIASGLISREQIVVKSKLGPDHSGIGSKEITARTSGTGSWESGAGSRESGAGPRESGAGSRESGAGTQESGAGSRESGAGSRQSGAGSQESGAVIPESGAGSRESGAGSQVSGVGSQESGAAILRSGAGSQESGGGFQESSARSRESGARSEISGAGSQKSGAVLLESGAGSRESGAGSRESGAGSRESGAGSQESGAGSRESGAGSRESGAGSRESGAGSQTMDPDKWMTTPVPQNLPLAPETPSSDTSAGVQDLTSGVGVILSREVSSGLPPEDAGPIHYSQEEFDSLTASLDDVSSEDAASHGVRRSRETQEVTSSERRQPEVDMPMNMEAVVRNLQSQLLESQTSQARTRSILNTLQERQVAQDRDLSSLKQELSLLRRQQEADHTALEEVRGRVSDTAWAVKDLKASTDQLHADFSVFKRQQNDSMLESEDPLGGSRHHQLGYTDLIKRLHRDVVHMKTSQAADRVVMARLKRLLHNLDWARRQMTSRHDHNNNIPLGSGDPSSGGNDGAANFRSDNTATVTEDEEESSIGQSIVELHRNRHHMHMQIENVNRRFLQYDAEMSRVYAMYYNLSLQIAGLENKILTRQQQSFDSDLAALQRSFFNFTQQVFNAEQLHMTTSSQRNATEQNERRMRRISSSVDNHQMRIRTIENLLVDFRSTNQDFRRMLDAHLTSMNDSVVTVRGRLKDHKSKATLTFGEVQQRLADLRSEVKRHNRRLLQVEVHSLNESLSQCRKVNEDMVQDMRIDQVRSDLRRLDGQVGDHTGQINRHDRSLGSIYKEVQGNNRLVGEVMTQSKVLFDLVPRTDMLEEEINKLLMHLPKDCAAPVAENHRSGLYLVKPAGSVQSVQVYCELDAGGAWLVVQRRSSGAESFARTWDEYRAGFGSPDDEFWIGNDHLHRLTSQDHYRLHIDMWDLDDVYYYVKYDYFRIEAADTNYRLLIDGYHGNATDALRYSNYMPFSTMDRDHDVSSTHCAKFYTSGWWYKHCHYSNLNGRYTVGVVWFNHDFDEWIQMKRTVMKIQVVNTTLSTTS